METDALDEAAEHLKRAAALDPKMPEAPYNSAISPRSAATTPERRTISGAPPRCGRRSTKPITIWERCCSTRATPKPARASRAPSRSNPLKRRPIRATVALGSVVWVIYGFDVPDGRVLKFPRSSATVIGTAAKGTRFYVGVIASDPEPVAF